MASDGLLDRLREEAAQKRAWQRRHRARRRATAFLRGYFWMPCPLCGHEFGGHEWRGYLMLPGSEPGMSHGVCPACELDLGITAVPYCDEHGHTPIQILAQGNFRGSGTGHFEASLSVDPNATPLDAYCIVCGVDLPIDT